MITTVSLTNTHPHTVTTFYFLLMRTFKIYSLSNLQTQTGGPLVMLASLYVTFPGLIYHVTGSWDLLNAIVPFCSPQTPTSGNTPNLFPCTDDFAFSFSSPHVSEIMW